MQVQNRSLNRRAPSELRKMRRIVGQNEFLASPELCKTTNIEI